MGRTPPRMGNPLSSGGIQFESTLILPALSSLSYPIVDLVAENPTDWITARRRISWPWGQKIRAL